MTVLDIIAAIGIGLVVAIVALIVWFLTGLGSAK